MLSTAPSLGQNITLPQPNHKNIGHSTGTVHVFHTLPSLRCDVKDEQLFFALRWVGDPYENLIQRFKMIVIAAGSFGPDSLDRLKFASSRCHKNILRARGAPMENLSMVKLVKA